MVNSLIKVDKNGKLRITNNGKSYIIHNDNNKFYYLKDNQKFNCTSTVNKYKKGGDDTCKTIYSTPNVDGSCWVDSLVSCLFYPIILRNWFKNIFLPEIAKHPEYTELHQVITRFITQYDRTENDLQCPRESVTRLFYNKLMDIIKGPIRLSGKGYHSTTSGYLIIKSINTICRKHNIPIIFDIRLNKYNDMKNIPENIVIFSIIINDYYTDIQMKLKSGQELTASTIDVVTHTMSIVKCNTSTDIWLLNSAQTRYKNQFTSLSFNLDTFNPFDKDATFNNTRIGLAYQPKDKRPQFITCFGNDSTLLYLPDNLNEDININIEYNDDQYYIIQRMLSKTIKYKYDTLNYDKSIFFLNLDFMDDIYLIYGCSELYNIINNKSIFINSSTIPILLQWDRYVLSKSFTEINKEHILNILKRNINNFHTGIMEYIESKLYIGNKDYIYICQAIYRFLYNINNIDIIDFDDIKCDDYNKFATGIKEYDDYYEKEVLPIWCTKSIKEAIDKYRPNTIPDIEKLTIILLINYLDKEHKDYLLQKLENLEEIKQIRSYYSKGGLKTKKKNT